MHATLMPRLFLTLATLRPVSEKNALRHTEASNGDMLMKMIC